MYVFTVLCRNNRIGISGIKLSGGKLIFVCTLYKSIFGILGSFLKHKIKLLKIVENNTIKVQK